MPLSHRRPVLELAGAGGGVAAQLARDRRRRAPDLTSDLPHTPTLRAQQRDVLALGKAQVPRRRRVQRDRRHPATLPKPPDADRPRDPGERGRLNARVAARDRQPEPPPVIDPPNRRPSRRSHPRPPRLLPRLDLRPHRNVPSSGCCDDRLNPPWSPRRSSPIQTSTSTHWSVGKCSGRTTARFASITEQAAPSTSPHGSFT